MKVKKLVRTLVGTTLTYLVLNSSLLAQSEPDSTFVSMGQLEKETIVEDTQEKKPKTTIQQRTGEIIHQNDLFKSLQTHIPGYVSPISNTAKAVKDNLDQSNFQTYLQLNHVAFPVLGSTTEFRNVLSRFDNKMFSLDFKSSAYSTFESSLASTMILKPRSEYVTSVNVSNDLIKRNAVLNLYTNNEDVLISNKLFFGNTGVPEIFEDNFESLKLFPNGLSIQDYLSGVTNEFTFETFLDFSNSVTKVSKKDGNIRGVKNLVEDNNKKLLAGSIAVPINEDDNISFGLSYQGNTTNMELEMEDKQNWNLSLENFHLGTVANIGNWKLGTNYNHLINKSQDEEKTKNVIRFNGQRNFVYDNMLLELSAGLIFSDKMPEKTGAGRFTYFMNLFEKDIELAAGYGNYYEPLSNNNMSTENSLSVRDLVEKWSEQYVASVLVNIDNEFLRDISAEYYDKIIVDRVGDKKNRVWVNGVNFRVTNDYVTVSYSRGFNAKQKGNVLPGAIMKFLQVQTGFDIGEYKISMLLGIDDGYYDKLYNANPNEKSTGDDVVYGFNEAYVKHDSKFNLNLGVKRELDIFGGKINLSFMLGNIESLIFGEKQVVRSIKTPVGIEKIYAPTIANVGLSGTYEF